MEVEERVDPSFSMGTESNYSKGLNDSSKLSNKESKSQNTNES